MSNLTYQVEMSFVGCLLIGGLTAKARELMTWIEPEMFATHRLGAMYTRIRKQARCDNLIDMVLLEASYGEHFADMVEVAKNTTGAANIDGYAAKLHALWVNRSAQKTLLSVANKLTSARDDELEGITQAGLAELQRLLNQRQSAKPVLVGDLLESYVKVVQERSKTDFDERLLRTGLAGVDDILGGISPTDITVIAGRPGMGKTEFALTVSRHILNRGGSVLFFSLEMDNFQLIDRLLSAMGGLGVKKLRNPLTMGDEDFARMGEGISEIQNKKLYLVDRGGLSATEMTTIAENHLSNVGALNAIVIDYLGLIDHGSDKGNLTQQIGLSLAQLKTFCKNFQVPIILLSQLNRDVDGRIDKRPRNSDLRDSGNIEQDASQILMLYRERAYKPESENPYTEVLVTKSRFGELGTAYMRFEKGHFADCDQAAAYQHCQAQSPSPTGHKVKRYG